MPETSREHGTIPLMDMASVKAGASVDTPAPSMSPLIRWVLPGGIAALAIALIGGYAFGWS